MSSTITIYILDCNRLPTQFSVTQNKQPNATPSVQQWNDNATKCNNKVLNELYNYMQQYLPHKIRNAELDDIYIYTVYNTQSYECIVQPPYSPSMLVKLLNDSSKENKLTIKATNDVFIDVLQHICNKLDDDTKRTNNTYSLKFHIISSVFGDTVFCKEMMKLHGTIACIETLEKLELQRVSLLYLWIGSGICDYNSCCNTMQQFANTVAEMCTDVPIEPHVIDTVDDYTSQIVDYDLLPSQKHYINGTLYLQHSIDTAQPVHIQLRPINKSMQTSHNVDVCKCCSLPLPQPKLYDIKRQYNNSDTVAICSQCDADGQQLDKYAVTNAVKLGNLTYIKPMFNGRNDSSYDRDLCYTCAGWNQVVTCEGVLCYKSFHWSCAGLLYQPDTTASFICRYCRETDDATIIDQPITHIKPRQHNINDLTVYNSFMQKFASSDPSTDTISFQAVGVVSNDTGNQLIKYRSSGDCYYVHTQTNQSNQVNTKNTSYECFVELLNVLQQRQSNLLVRCVKLGDVALSTCVLKPYNDSVAFLLPVATAEQIVHPSTNTSQPVSHTEHDKEAAIRMVNSMLAVLTVDAEFDGSKLDSGTMNEFQALIQEASCKIINRYPSQPPPASQAASFEQWTATTLDVPLQPDEYNMFDDIGIQDTTAPSQNDVIAMAKSRHAKAQYIAARQQHCRLTTDKQKQRNPYDYSTKSRIQRIEKSMLNFAYVSLERRSDNTIDIIDAAEHTMEYDSDTADAMQYNDMKQQEEWIDDELDDYDDDFIVDDNDDSCQIDTVRPTKPVRKRLHKQCERDQKQTNLSHHYIDTKINDIDTTYQDVTVRNKRRTH